MRGLKFLLFIAIFSILTSIQAQNANPADTINCPISQSKQLLAGRPFASMKPILLRVFNENYEYAVIQLGKRKGGTVFLYFKIFTDNVCVKQEQPIEIYFESGEIYTLKNVFAVNCEGTAALQLTSKDIRKLSENKINTIKLFTLNKDYEFSPTDHDNQTLKEYLNCLRLYKVKSR